MSVARLMQQAAAGSAGAGPAPSGWTDPDLANASYDSKSFATTTQENVPFDLDFTPDGTSFVIVGQGTDTVYQYGCSTAWDISTASYASKSLSLSAQMTSPRGIQWSDDGTKVYVLGNVTDRIYQYDLSTAYDISTGSYSGASLDLTTAALNYQGGQFYIPFGGSQSGTRVYVGCFNTDRIYSWTLSTAWDLTTASLDTTNFPVGTFDAVHAGMYVNPDGTKWWFGARQSDSIFQFSMSTPYDISTSSKDSAELSWAGQTNDIAGFKFSADGLKMYGVSTGNDTIYQYSTAAAAPASWTDPDLANASYDSVSFSFASQDISPVCGIFSADGTKMFALGFATDTLYQYSLTTAWDISTASYDSVSFTVSSQDTTPTGVRFDTTGLKMYIVGTTSDSVHQYSLTTAWDISTASYDSVSFSVASQQNSPYDLAFNATGTKMYVIGFQGDTAYQYSLTTAWDISTASYDSVSFYVGAQEGNPLALTFNPDGSKMYVTGFGTDNVYQYSLSTPYDLSTASYDSISFYVGLQEISPRCIAFKSDGSKMYITGPSDWIHQYSTA